MDNILAKGGKGKGLVWLAENTDIGYSVPKFDILNISYHEDILKQGALANIIGALQTKVTGQLYVGKITGNVKRLEDKCEYLANQFKGKNVMVRSSALISEDNNKFSGAGIYDSFEISSKNLSPQSILNAVLKIYSSVDSERAVQYRKSNGLDDERMEVVVQKLEEGYNGVAMSRLQARAGIIPVSWSELRGAVVGSANVKDRGKVHTSYFTPINEYPACSLYRNIFQTTNIPLWQTECIEDTILPIVENIKKRYNKEFELEFVVNLPDRYKSYEVKGVKPVVHLVQIRPLTNIQDKKVEFPNKESLMEAKLCMGVGEYIGSWFIPEQIREGWNEPQHYAYASTSLDQTIPKSLEQFASILGNKTPKDYDKLTPNKKAIVLTKYVFPGQHALSIANEKRLICLLGEMEDELSDEEFQRQHGFTRTMVERLGPEGKAILSRPAFKVPLNKVGNYIHIVSDGLKGRVYRATEEEAREFEKRLF